MSGGRRLRGGVSGASTGLGIAVLLQQFAVVPLTTTVLGGLVVGFVLIGVALAWPRGAEPVAPQGQPPAPS